MFNSFIYTMAMQFSECPLDSDLIVLGMSGLYLCVICAYTDVF